MKDTLKDPDLKTELRKEALSRRDSIPPPVRKIKDASICERLFSLDTVRDSRTILLYAAFRSEVGTERIIRKALEAGKTVLVPKVYDQEGILKLYEIGSLEDLKPGYMGIPEPEALDEKLRDMEGVDVVVLPGAGFDEKGYRLGYGKGYYDKLLATAERRPSLVALAYEEQMLANVPAEPHDVGMDIIVTDRRTVICKENRNGPEED